jgi:LPS-assembly lipoprotein
MSKIFQYQFICLLTLALGLSGCGFKLRSSHQLPVELQTLQLNTTDRYSELARLLRTQFTANGIDLVKDVEKGTVTEFKLYRDKLDRRTLSLFPNGQVAEFGLIYSVRYAITIAGKPSQPFDFEIYRDYQDDPTSALAKSKELKLILKEMRQQAADKIMRQMASFNQSSS